MVESIQDLMVYSTEQKDQNDVEVDRWTLKLSKDDRTLMCSIGTPCSSRGATASIPFVKLMKYRTAFTFDNSDTVSTLRAISFSETVPSSEASLPPLLENALKPCME